MTGGCKASSGGRTTWAEAGQARGLGQDTLHPTSKVYKGLQLAALFESWLCHAPTQALEPMSSACRGRPKAGPTENTTAQWTSTMTAVNAITGAHCKQGGAEGRVI